MSENYERGIRLFFLNVAVGLGTFIQVLDSSIANVAVPYIAGNLSVGADQGTWVITSFAASNAIVLPLTGWLSDYFGRVNLFVWSVLLFALMSFLCGFATTLTMLIVFRVLQGAVAGTLIPLSQSLIMVSNPPEKQGTALGFWAMIVVVAPVLGPIIGGYLTYEYSWPWIFYINVPIGIFSAFVTWIILKDKESKIVRKPIDWIGLFLLAVGVACLQIMLDKGKDLDWFESNVIYALLIVAVISLGYFGIWTYFQKYPIVDFSFFKNRNFALGTLIITIGFLIYFGSAVTLPLWLQTQQNYTAFWAGIAVSPIGIAPFFLAPIVGNTMNRFDLRVLGAISFLILATSFFVQANFTTQVSLHVIMITRFFQGFGVALFFLPILQLSLGEIPKEKYASATGLYNFIRILVGSGFGTSLSIELWTHREIFHHANLVEAWTASRLSILHFYDKITNHNPILTTDVINRVSDKAIEQQAYMLSTNDIAWLGACLFLLMIPMVFLCKRIKSSFQTKSMEG